MKHSIHRPTTPTTSGPIFFSSSFRFLPHVTHRPFCRSATSTRFRVNSAPYSRLTSIIWALITPYARAEARIFARSRRQSSQNDERRPRPLFGSYGFPHWAQIASSVTSSTIGRFRTE